MGMKKSLLMKWLFTEFTKLLRFSGWRSPLDWLIYFIEWDQLFSRNFVFASKLLLRKLISLWKVISLEPERLTAIDDEFTILVNHFDVQFIGIKGGLASFHFINNLISQESSLQDGITSRSGRWWWGWGASGGCAGGGFPWGCGGLLRWPHNNRSLVLQRKSNLRKN